MNAFQFFVLDSLIILIVSVVKAIKSFNSLYWIHAGLLSEGNVYVVVHFQFFVLDSFYLGNIPKRPLDFAFQFFVLDSK